MSAFVVGTDLIDLIVSAAWELSRRESRGAFVVRWDEGQAEWARGDLSALGGMILSENVRSVNYRYQDSMSEDTEELGYTFRPVAINVTTAATWWDVVSGIACVRYQSCEHPEWGDSLAKRVLDRVERLVIDHITPETAAWCWTREEGQSRIAAARARIAAEMGSK